MKLYSTKKIIILFAVLIVILAGLHYVAFSFIQKAGLEVSTLEQDVRVLQAQVLEFSKYSAEDVKNLAQSITDHFISRTNIVSFIENLEREARAQDVSVTIRSVNVEPRSDDPADDKEMIRLKFETHGSWADTMNFANYIEHLPYKVSLRGLGLVIETRDGASGSASSSSPWWRGEFEITTRKFT